jgi:hypothetical protein
MSLLQKWRTAANTISATEEFSSRGGVQNGNPQSTASTRVPRPRNNNGSQSQPTEAPQPGSQRFRGNSSTSHGHPASSYLVEQPSMPQQWSGTTTPHNRSPPAAWYQQDYQSEVRQASPSVQHPDWLVQPDNNTYGQPQYLQPSSLNTEYPVQYPHSQPLNRYTGQVFGGQRTPERRFTTDSTGTWSPLYDTQSLSERPVAPLQRVFSDPLTYPHSCHDYWD